ncbi:MAG: hypothetical protein ACK4Z0_00815 [Sphingomonadaceae bacterium]
MGSGGWWYRLVPGLVAAMMLAVAPVAASGWHRADGPNFRIHGARAPAELAEQVRLLEAFRHVVAELQGRNPAEPGARLDVFLVSSPADASPWLPLRPGVAGFYRADVGRISAFIVDRPPRGAFDVDRREVLLHEVAHHLLLAGGLAWPAWYVEGFADYVATARFEADRVELGRAGANRLGWLRQGDWLPLEQVLRFDPERASPADVPRLYAQGWLLTHWLRHDEDRARRLKAYLEACAAGADPVEAFRRHVAADLRDVEASLRAYLADGPPILTRPLQWAYSSAAVRPAALPRSAGTLLMRLVAMEHGMLPADRNRALADVRRLAMARAASDPLAARTLARAELLLGNPEVAASVAARLVETGDAEPDLLRLRADSLRSVAGRDPIRNRADARDALLAALAADPQDWQARHGLARLDRIEGRDALPHLVAAHRLAPQVKAITLETAVALARAGRAGEAADLLADVAHAPGGGAASELAARMRAHALRGDDAALIAEVARLGAAPTVAATQGERPGQLR